MTASGVGRIYRRATTWWIRYSVHGERVRESSGSSHRADAVRLLRQRLVEAAQGRIPGPKAERLRFDDLAHMLLDDYAVNGRKSTERARRSLAHLRWVCHAPSPMTRTHDVRHEECVKPHSYQDGFRSRA